MKIRFKAFRSVLVGLLGLGAMGFSPAWAEAARNVAAYNLQSGVGLKGYDPVAVFSEGGGKAQMGRADLNVDYLGVVYHFAKAENREMFLRQPERYEPTYGGYCAYAMASGTSVDILPQHFTIHGNRAHYFVSSRAKREFDRDVRGFESRADRFWKMISGESPRF